MIINATVDELVEKEVGEVKHRIEFTEEVIDLSSFEYLPLHEQEHFKNGLRVLVKRLEQLEQYFKVRVE
jgi:hypothetical protein